MINSVVGPVFQIENGYFRSVRIIAREIWICSHDTRFQSETVAVSRDNQCVLLSISSLRPFRVRISAYVVGTSIPVGDGRHVVNLFQGIPFYSLRYSSICCEGGPFQSYIVTAERLPLEQLVEISSKTLRFVQPGIGKFECKSGQFKCIERFKKPMK